MEDSSPKLILKHEAALHWKEGAWAMCAVRNLIHGQGDHGGSEFSMRMPFRVSVGWPAAEGPPNIQSRAYEEGPSSLIPLPFFTINRWGREQVLGFHLTGSLEVQESLEALSSTEGAGRGGWPLAHASCEMSPV